MSKKIIIFIIAIVLLIFGAIYYTERQAENGLEEKEFYTREDLQYIEPQPGTANIYYMWMAGCSACAALDKWFEEMKEVYSIKVYKFSIARESALFRDMLEAYDVPMARRGAVPTVFIGENHFVGFDPEAMENLIKECLQASDCVNPYDKLR